MPFCWLCTHSEANCMFTPLGSERSAAPADSVIPGLRVCRHVSAATGLSTSLGSLHIGRQYRGLTRGLPRKFLPSPLQFVQDAGLMEPGQRPLERAWISSETAELGSLVPQNKMHKWRFKIFFVQNNPLQNQCSMWRVLLCVFLNMKIKAQPSCVRNGLVFLEHVLEIYGCGDIVLMKYQLMVCESCILIMLMFFFFFFAPRPWKTVLLSV